VPAAFFEPQANTAVAACPASHRIGLRRRFTSASIAQRVFNDFAGFVWQYHFIFGVPFAKSWFSPGLLNGGV
jgi:hypothetical protein